jgi:hypothetical protein
MSRFVAFIEWAGLLDSFFLTSFHSGLRCDGSGGVCGWFYCLWLVICWYVCIVDLAHEKDDLRKAISVSIKTLYIVLAIFAERCIQSETTENTEHVLSYYRVKTLRISNGSSRVFVVDNNVTSATKLGEELSRDVVYLTSRLLVYGFSPNDDEGSPRLRKHWLVPWIWMVLIRDSLGLSSISKSIHPNHGTRAIQRPLQMSDQTESGTFNCNHCFNENKRATRKIKSFVKTRPS